MVFCQGHDGAAAVPAPAGASGCERESGAPVFFFEVPAAAAAASAFAAALFFSQPSRNSPQGPIPALANRKEMGPWASVAARTAAKTFFFFFFPCFFF